MSEGDSQIKKKISPTIEKGLVTGLPKISTNDILTTIGDRLVTEARIPTVPIKGIDIFFYQIRDDPRGEVQSIRDEYFEEGSANIFEKPLNPPIGCTSGRGEDPNTLRPLSDVFGVACWKINGRRGAALNSTDPNAKIPRLMLGDAWHAMIREELGLFEIFAALMDQYTTNKDHRIPGTDFTGITLEAFSQLVKRGYYVTSRQRSGCYRKLLGMVPAQLRPHDQPEVKTNSNFSKLFPQLVHLSLRYFRERRVIDVIQATSSSSGGSTSTVTDIRNIAKLLNHDNEDLLPSGNSYKTLCDILAYEIGIIDLIRNTRNAIGITAAQDRVSEYISAVYEKLVTKDKKSQSNRYLLFSQLADTGRDIITAFEEVDKDSNDEVEALLGAMESTIEEFNNAYRTLFVTDLAVDSKDPNFEVSFVHTV